MEAESRITRDDKDPVSNQQSMAYLPAKIELKGLTKDGLSTIPLLAWALVLQKFSDTDIVAFGVHNNSSSGTSEESSATESSVCVVSIDPEAQVRDYLSESRHKLEPFGLECRPGVSTAILFHRDEKDLEEPLGFISGTRCRDHVRIHVEYPH